MCNYTQPEDLEVLKTTISTLIGFTGLLGNAFVIVIFLTNQKIFSTITNLLILNQSAIDLAVSGVFLLLQFDEYMPINSGSTTLNTIACKVWTSEYLLWSLYVCSSMNLVAISLERYCATCFSIKHLTFFTRKKTKLIMLCVWLFGFVYECHWPLGFAYQLNSVTNTSECKQVQREQTGLIVLAGIFFFCVEYFVPVAVMTFSYWRIITMLKKRGKQRDFFRRAKHSVTKTLLIVSVMFVICWGPAEIEYLLFNLGVDICFGGPIHQLGITLVQLNACLNPCIYSLQYNQFKSILKRTFCPTCLGLDKDSSSSNQGMTSNSNTKNYSHNNI